MEEYLKRLRVLSGLSEALEKAEVVYIDKSSKNHNFLGNIAYDHHSEFTKETNIVMDRRRDFSIFPKDEEIKILAARKKINDAIEEYKILIADISQHHYDIADGVK